MSQDALDHRRLVNQRHEAQPPTPTRTGQDVEAKRPPHQLGPLIRASPGALCAARVPIFRGCLLATAARRYFAGDDLIGRWIAFGGAASPAREIVGIVADIKDGPPETSAHPSAYVPFDPTEFALVIRTRLDKVALASSLAAAVREIRSDALIGGIARS